MNRNASILAYATDGTAALEPRPARRLVLIEGGRGQAASRPSSRRRGGLGLRQLLAAALAGALVIVLVALASAASDGFVSASVARSLSDVPTTSIVVTGGDSLWSIAEERAVDGVDTASLVQWIREANALDGSLLRPGQGLVVPVGD